MIEIYANKQIKTITNFWNNIHFHPTDAIEDDWGKRILDNVKTDSVANTVRMYTMLEDIVSINDKGEFVYDFTLNDVRLDYMKKQGFGILLSYNFIPPCIAEKPNVQSNVSKNKTRYKGKMITTSKPKDYALWEEVCYQYTKHIVERYGLDTVSSWYLQCYNEPDIQPFFLSDLDYSPEAKIARYTEYVKLYKGFASGVMRVSDKLKIGGPSVAGDLNYFLKEFLLTTKRENIRLDFISIHTYGSTPPKIANNTRPLCATNTLQEHEEHLKIINEVFPEGKEIIVDEWGAATQGFFNRDECPELMFREDSRFAVYFGKMITAYVKAGVSVSKMMICLSGQHEMLVDFSGFRNFFTLNFIKKPIYNAYVITAKLKSVMVDSATDNSDIDLLATKDEKGNYAILLSYASQNFDKNLPRVNDCLNLQGVNGDYNVKIWQIDENNTNPYNLAKSKGWADVFDSEQIKILQEEGNIAPITQYKAIFNGCGEIPLSFSNNALLLIELERMG